MRGLMSQGCRDNVPGVQGCHLCVPALEGSRGSCHCASPMLFMVWTAHTPSHTRVLSCTYTIPFRAQEKCSHP